MMIHSTFFDVQLDGNRFYRLSLGDESKHMKLALGKLYRAFFHGRRLGQALHPAQHVARDQLGDGDQLAFHIRVNGRDV